MIFTEYVAEHQRGLLRFATALTTDEALAEDVVQDVLTPAFERWDRIAAVDQPHAYVRRMIVNEYLSWRRRRAARTIASTHSTLDAIGTPTADPATGYAERDAMRTRIAALPRKQRAALLLRYYEDRTFDEIAEVLGCSAGTVRSHISRALGTLRAAHQQPVREALS